MKSSTQDRAEGTFHKIKGQLKEIVWKLSDNPKLEASSQVYVKYKDKSTHQPDESFIPC